MCLCHYVGVDGHATNCASVWMDIVTVCVSVSMVIRLVVRRQLMVICVGVDDYVTVTSCASALLVILLIVLPVVRWCFLVI